MKTTIDKVGNKNKLFSLREQFLLHVLMATVEKKTEYHGKSCGCFDDININNKHWPVCPPTIYICIPRESTDYFLMFMTFIIKNIVASTSTNVYLSGKDFGK